jgi:septal ring factor EnvC (AmiA/AmiB activator)
MNSLSLILRILAVIAAVAAGVLFYMGKGKLAEQKAAMEAAQNATVVVQGELAEANEQIATLEGQLAEERSALSQTKRDLENTRSEMYTARQEVSRTQQQLSQARDNITDLEEAAKRLRGELVEVEQSLAVSNQAVDELASVREQLAELEDRNDELTADLRAARNPASNRGATAAASSGSLQTGSANYSSGFKPSNSQPLASASIGPETTIQSVSTENGLIVLANSSELQLAPGTQVTLVQDMKSLGKVSVTQTTEEFVVANILPGAKARGLTVGSTVKLLR